MSYDTSLIIPFFVWFIERSPDHWWVTTKSAERYAFNLALKGHQIIGELRPQEHFACSLIFIERSPDHWWVTTSNAAAVYPTADIERSPDHWWVTTTNAILMVIYVKLKGHQIIGELRRYIPMFISIVTRLKGHQIIGELRLFISRYLCLYRRLKGHQIIGELRPKPIRVFPSQGNWKVTRSLVSYDLKRAS